MEPIGGYDELAPHAELIRLGSLAVRVISLDDLLKIKRRLGRPKDQDALPHLEAIKRMQQEPERGRD